jgi:hypothetical protein
MANPHFSVFMQGDFELRERLISGLIYDRGIGVKWLPKELVAIDQVMNEVVVSQFDEAIDLDILVEAESSEFIAPNPMFAFGGFSFSPDNNVKFHFLIKEATAKYGRVLREGDLIFIHEVSKVFEISAIEREDVFRTGGKLVALVGFMSIHQPSEGTTHFKGDAVEIPAIDMLLGVKTPESMFKHYISADSTIATVDHVRSMKLGLKQHEERYTADAEIVEVKKVEVSDGRDPNFELTVDLESNVTAEDLEQQINQMQDLLDPNAANEEIRKLDILDTELKKNSFGFL